MPGVPAKGKGVTLAPTPENKALVEAMVNNPKNFVKVSTNPNIPAKNPKKLFVKTLKDGTTIYAYTQKGVIKGGGVADPKLLPSFIENF